MSENENVGIELGVDADAALSTLQELTAAALTADDAIQQLKQHQVELANAIPGNPQSSSYTEVATRFQQMDPSLIRDTYPEIAQTQNALNARRTEVRAQAMDFVGANPQVAAQPLPDTLAQFQQAMVQREQQQQAQRERQAQQQAAGFIPPARYGYEAAPVLAPPVATAGAAPQGLPTGGSSVSPTNAPLSLPTPTGVPANAPLATTGDDRLAQALSAQTPTPTPLTSTATGVRDNDAPMGDVLPAESGRSSPAPPQPRTTATGRSQATPDDAPPRPSIGVPSSAPLATTGDDRLTQALTAHSQPTATTATPDAATGATPDAATGATPDAVATATGPLPQTFEELAAAAREADTQLQDLKQRLLDAFNAIPRGSQPEAASYDAAVGRLQQMDPSLVQELHPDIARTQAAITGRQSAIGGEVRDFAADNPEAAAEPLPAQQDMLTRWQDLLRQHNAQQQAATVPGQGGDDALPNAGGATYYRQSARSGPFVPPGMERLARYGYDAAQQMDAHDARQRSGLPGLNGGNSGNGGGNGNDTTQQDRTATVLSDHIVQAFSRSAGGLVAGGISGAANAAGMGATGDVLAGLVRPLIGMIGEAAPLAIGAIGAIGGVAGVGLGINALQSQYAGESQTLAGSVGTTTGATPSSELDIARQAGWPLMFHEAQSVAAAQQLGDVGVQSGQLGGALTASMDLARVGGIGLDQTTALTGQMMQGGMSANQVGDTYAQMDQAARESGISLGRLVDGMKALNQVAGVGQISVNGLVAAQAMSDQTGMKIDIGQAMAGTIGSTGTNALAQGYMLGLNPAQFDEAQSHPDKLWDAYASTARRYDVGPGGSRIAQQALSEAGFDFSGMKGNQAETFIQKLVAEGPNAAQKYEASLQKKEAAPGAPGPHTFAELTKAGVTVAHDITSASAQAKLDLERGAAVLVQDLGRAGDGLKVTTALTAPAAHAQSAANEAQQAIIDAARKRGATAQLHIVQTAQNPAAKAQALLAYEAITSGQDYANDPNAAGTMDASGSPQFGGLSEYQLSQARQSGTWVGGGPGKGSFVSAETFHAYEQAARKTGTPLAVLLAQGTQEATINGAVDPLAGTGPGHGGNLPGIGLGQWTPGPHNENLPTVEHYLGMASKDLGLGAVTGQNWRQAALNPRVSALATGIYDADNYASKQAGGRWDHALAQYQGGPNGWNYTGHPGQGRDYGTTVNQAALKVEVQLGGSVDITQNGQKVGTAQSGQHIRATATHSIDTSRKHVAAQSYGPDQRPPSPGLPHLPGHLGAPIRR